jgi:CheY-like chemotaxis protein
VLVASDGEDALQVSAGHMGDIHLLLTDVVMPKMGGSELAHALQAASPSLKVIYMSGYTDDAIINHGVLKTGMSFIGKPFTEDNLIRKVQEVLSGAIVEVVDQVEVIEAPNQERKGDIDPPARIFGKDKLGALPVVLLDRLREAVIAARYDEILEIAETARAIDAESGDSLARMAESFDYDGMRELLGP